MLFERVSFVGIIIFIIIMKRTLALFILITMIAILHTSLIVEAFLSAIFVIEARFTMTAFPEIVLGGIVMFVSSDVLVKVAFLVAFIVEISVFFIFILAILFMKAAGLLSLFVVRRLPVAATSFATLRLSIASIISSHVAVSLPVLCFGIVML